jgi:hypothetical protein
VEHVTVNKHVDRHGNKMNEEEYKQVLEERGKQWDKHLDNQKHKNVSKEGRIEMKLREANMKRAEELAKQNDGKFNLQV